MHAVEPFFQWRDFYTAESDKRSPFYGREYDEFEFHNSIYNYYIHPQWDYFGSSTLYIKILFTDYEKGFTILELIGEWNDTLHNDIMFLKRNIADPLVDEGIKKFILICDNVLNYHPSENYYLEEWKEDLEGDGWLCCINLLDHVYEDFLENKIQYYIHFDEKINDMEWRLMKPDKIFEGLEKYITQMQKKLDY